MIKQHEKNPNQIVSDFDFWFSALRFRFVSDLELRISDFDGRETSPRRLGSARTGRGASPYGRGSSGTVLGDVSHMGEGVLQFS